MAVARGGLQAVASALALMVLAACSHDRQAPEVRNAPSPALPSVGMSIAEKLSVLSGLPPSPGDVAAIDSVYGPALDRLDDTSVTAWRSTSGRNGTIHPVSRHSSDRGAPCRVFDHEHVIADRLYRGRATACLAASGVWVLTSADWFPPVALTEAPANPAKKTASKVPPKGSAAAPGSARAPSNLQVIIVQPQSPPAAAEPRREPIDAGVLRGEPARSPNSQGQVGRWKNLGGTLAE